MPSRWEHPAVLVTRSADFPGRRASRRLPRQSFPDPRLCQHLLPSPGVCRPVPAPGRLGLLGPAPSPALGQRSRCTQTPAGRGAPDRSSPGGLHRPRLVGTSVPACVGGAGPRVREAPGSPAGCTECGWDEGARQPLRLRERGPVMTVPTRVTCLKSCQSRHGTPPHGRLWPRVRRLTAHGLGGRRAGPPGSGGRRCPLPLLSWDASPGVASAHVAERRGRPCITSAGGSWGPDGCAASLGCLSGASEGLWHGPRAGRAAVPTAPGLTAALLARVSRAPAARLGTWALQDASSDGLLPSWWLREIFSHAFLARFRRDVCEGARVCWRPSHSSPEQPGDRALWPAREPRQAVLTVSWAGAARPAATQWCHVGGPGPGSGASGQWGLLVGAQPQRSPGERPE